MTEASAIEPTAESERLFRHGKVFTGRGENDFATAFRIDEGRFTWVGDAEDIEGEDAVDLAGRVVLPGFLDVHTHPSMMASLIEFVSLLPPEVLSVGAVQDALRSHPAYGSGPGSWILGFGFDEMWFTDEKRKPTVHDLDTVSRTQPILIRRCDGHTVVCNSVALALAGIDDDTPDPDGAIIHRDADGRLTGALSELAAINLVDSLIPRPSLAEQAQRLASLNEHFLSRGIVGVDDLYATFDHKDPLAMYRTAASEGFVPQSGLYLGWTDLVDGANGGEVADLTDEQRTGRIRVAGVKLLMDGAFSDRHAWLEDPYPDSCSHGSRVVSDEELLRAVAWSRRNHVQVAVHAMGDRAINQVISLLEDQEPWMGELPSVRIDHASLFTPQMIDRIETARMSFGVISHTIFYFAEYESYKQNLSAEQLPHAYPIRSFYEKATHAALASDSPATSWADADNVFISIRAAVDRRSHNGGDLGQDQAITVPQAVLLYTGRASTVAPFESLGTIAPGAEGTFVVLDRDLFTIPTAEIGDVTVAETWVAGEQVWRA
ncbi:amidohydrolase [Rhodococcus sp. T2V]|uniref:amidohydrolase n=1 Tax=Rhodococcus sp. T2V TaxID=3034164 RepID=UPI0023E2ED72|nr:amidohydrolase [Rhodococcus sp. T2V]MDF3312841.1 amidohydrolase [Rhodococcus sp. T2V]